MKKVALLFLQLWILHSVAGNTFADHVQRSAYGENNRTVLKGKFDNFKGDSITLHLTGAAGEDLRYTIAVRNGEFSIPDRLISSAGIARLAVANVEDDFSIPVLLAPDYNFFLRADVRNAGTLSKSLHFSGKGSATNNFYKEMVHDRRNYPALGNDNFDEWHRKMAKTTDSLYQYYDQIYHDRSDTNFGYFRKLIYDDLAFYRLDMLMQKAWSMLDQVSAGEVNSFVRAHFDPKILDDISDNQYLASPSYRDLMGFSFWYLFYLVKYDEKLSPDTTRSKYQVYLDKITNAFKGNVRDYVLYKFVNLNLVAATNSYDKFQERSQVTMPYLNDFKNKWYYDKLMKLILRKENELAGLKTGDPAPMFSLADSTGKRYDLAFFRHKIVVLDFWASWCGPCRQQTPFLETLNTKYKTDDRIAFISIAVRDKKSAWLKALEKDKPGWLQLFDEEGKTAADYFTNAIPKFVVIDGRGTIIDFQAPAPDEGDKLERLLEVCLKELK